MQNENDPPVLGLIALGVWLSSSGYGDGYGYGYGYGYGCGCGCGDGYGFGFGYGRGRGRGDGARHIKAVRARLDALTAQGYFTPALRVSVCGLPPIFVGRRQAIRLARMGVRFDLNDPVNLPRQEVRCPGRSEGDPPGDPGPQTGTAPVHGPGHW